MKAVTALTLPSDDVGAATFGRSARATNPIANNNMDIALSQKCHIAALRFRRIIHREYTNANTPNKAPKPNSTASGGTA